MLPVFHTLAAEPELECIPVIGVYNLDLGLIRGFVHRNTGDFEGCDRYGGSPP
jgi:hypothetical protein